MDNNSSFRQLGVAVARPTALPRPVLLGLGLLTIAVLLLEHGFAVSQMSLRWIHLAEGALAGCYVLDRILLLVRGPDRWNILRKRRLEFIVFGVAVLVGLALLVWSRTSPGVELFGETLAAHQLAFNLLKFFLLANVLVQLLRLNERLLLRGARPEWMLAGSFALLILAGTLLLLLPRASAANEERIGLLDAFFTATSASCVTGLSVRDTGTAFSTFGQTIILVLFQTGGLGIMTFVAFVAVTSAESLPVPQTLAFRKLVGARTPSALRKQVYAILAFTLLVEAAGATCLYFCMPAGDDSLSKLGWSVFHAVSAFCNAGFALSADSLTSLRSHPGAMLTFMALIILGGLGFLVVTDLLGLQLSRLPLVRRVPWVHRYNQRVAVYRMPIQSRLSVVVSAILILAGLAGFWLLEAGHTLSGKSFSEQFWICSFQSVTARTAGFNTIPVDHLQPATLLMMVALMVVGASPVSTGGGIKTVTFAVLLLSLRSLLAGRERVEIYGRALPQRVLMASLAVVFLYVLAASLGVFALSLFDPEMPLRRQMFEVVSALSTVGLSTGITPQLSAASKLVLCLLMFIGRVGPISLLLTVVRMERPARYQFPEEDLVVG